MSQLTCDIMKLFEEYKDQNITDEEIKLILALQGKEFLIDLQPTKVFYINI